MYIYIHISTKIYMYIYIHISTNIYIHIYMRTYLHMYTQIYIYSCIHVWIPNIFMAGRNACVTTSVMQDIYAYIYIYLQKYKYVYICVHIHTCIQKYVYIFIYTCMNTKYFHGRQECLCHNICKTWWILALNVAWSVNDRSCQKRTNLN